MTSGIDDAGACRARASRISGAATGRSYTGINVLLLWGAIIEHGFPCQSWLTFRQALAPDGNVRKRERGASPARVMVVLDPM